MYCIKTFPAQEHTESIKIWKACFCKEHVVLNMPNRNMLNLKHGAVVFLTCEAANRLDIYSGVACPNLN